MGRKAQGLTAAKVKSAKPGRYGDGNGLYLYVRSAEARFWLFRYTRAGRMREMGLGRAGDDDAAVKLVEARDRAAELLKLVRGGVDPLDKRDADAKAAVAEAQKAAIRGITFRTVAERYLEAHESTWRNPKHRKQWRNTLDSYATRTLAISQSQTWRRSMFWRPLNRFGASSLRRRPGCAGRIESILDYATARNWRDGENPARWARSPRELAARSKQGRRCRTPCGATLARDRVLPAAS